MPQFAYQGRDAQGKPASGSIEATGPQHAARLLQGQGITPLSIRPTRSTATSSGAAASEWLARLTRPKTTAMDVQLFSRQMYTLLKAGVPILRALEGLRQSSPNPAFAEVIRQIGESLGSGHDFATALRKHPKVFSTFYVSMVQVGEMTGQLDAVFMSLFDHMEFERDMRERVKTALRYPLFVVLAMIAAITVINIFVIPAFAKVFASFNAELPLMTRILLGASKFTIEYWPLLVVGVAGSVFLFRTWVGTPGGELTWDHYKMKLPIAGKIITKATLARFARSFALAQRSGVPVIAALSSVALVSDNAYMKQVIEDMRSGVERGESILRTAMNSGVFTPVVLQMIAIGEETGDLDGLLQEIADMYQREVDYELKTLSAQIEPILIIGLGILVLILALGVFLPLWELGSVSGGRR